MQQIFAMVKRNLWLILAAIIVPILFFPVVGGYDTDFQLYSLGGWLISQGKVPYVDFFDHKPPLVWYIFSLPSFIYTQLAHEVGVTKVNPLLPHFCLFFVIISIMTYLYLRVCAAFRLSRLPSIISLGVMFTPLIMARTYGSLNSSISFLSYVFILATLLVLQSNKEKPTILSWFFAGIFAASTFLIRYSPMAFFFIFWYLGKHLWLHRQKFGREFFKATVGGSLAFAFACFAFCLMIDWNFQAAYEWNYLFNAYYNTRRDNFFEVLPVSLLFTFSSVPFYFWLLLFIGAGHTYLTTKPADWSKERWTLALFWLSSEFILLLMQKPKMMFTHGLWFEHNQYIIPMNVTLAFVLGIMLHNYASTMRQIPKHIKWQAACIFGVFFMDYFSIASMTVRGRIANLVRWPDQAIIDSIKGHGGTGSFYTLDRLYYLYIATNSIPPVPALVKNSKFFDWEQLVSTGQTAEFEKKLKENPPNIIGASDSGRPKTFDLFDKTYEKIGTFSSVYKEITLYKKKF